MNNKRFDLTGKIAVVTGGTGVLGNAMVRGLAEHGAGVVIVGRNADKVRAAVVAFSEEGHTVDGSIADVLDEEALKKARNSIFKKYGRIDILVNAAGGHIPEAVQKPGQQIFDIELKNIRRTMDLNLFGSIYPTLIFAKIMVECGHGSIVNISSMAAERAVSRVLGYSLAKSSVESFTKWMSMELGFINNDRVRINAIAPGFFLTEQNRAILTNEDGTLTDRAEKIIAHTPVGRLGNPEEIVSTLIWLCSDDSKFITGTVVPVDGGFSKFSGV